MNKYYVTCGDLKSLTLANTSSQACFNMFADMPTVNKLNREIRVSEKGHDTHDDDELYNLSDMFCLWLLHINWGGKFSKSDD